MHTFFINTSKKSLQEYGVLFDIPTENSTFVSLEYPLAELDRKENGVPVCVAEMGSLIDGYAELNDTFNLVLYVDLSEQRAYTAIARNEPVKRNACLQALRPLLTHMLCNAIVAPLTEAGRQPQEVLILFGTDARFCALKGGNEEATFRAQTEKIYELLGFPEDAQLISCAKAASGEDLQQKAESFAQALEGLYQPEGIPGLREHYAPLLRAWREDLLQTQNLPQAKENLLQAILRQEAEEQGDFGMQPLDCPYDFEASRVNKKVSALSQLNIALHLLKCVNANSIYLEQEVQDYDFEEDATLSDTPYRKALIPFRAYEAHQLAEKLEEKKQGFANAFAWLKKLEKEYADLKLAPALPQFDHGKFGLDDVGDPEDTDQLSTAAEGPINNLFPQDYSLIDCKLEATTEGLQKRQRSADEYKKLAEKLRREHVKYLKKLKLQVNQRLSNYAGKSKENRPALLKIGGDRYALTKNDKPVMEEKAIEAVLPVANAAYHTVFDQYMAFCAARSVAVTDIEEPCQRYLTKIDQITKSLKNLRWVALGMLLAVPVLYLPYGALQFEAITENLLTLCCAMGSVAVPIGLLYGGFCVLAALQKRRYLAAGKELADSSNQEIENNARAARDFDRLLAEKVPSLRWVYEYKLDAVYCDECYALADAKIAHHKQQLSARVKAIDNIIRDLELTPKQPEPNPGAGEELAKKLECGRPFCAGQKNRAFYTVVDGAFLSDNGQKRR